ncbi:MAG: DUF5615 family PIN-like protein [bacterium]
MKVILDECLPRRLARDLHSHTITTVPRQGWAGRKDSELLSLIRGEFDVFVTMDSNLIYQQALPADSLCVIVLHAPNSCYETLLPLIERLLDAINNAKPGRVIELSE